MYGPHVIEWRFNDINLPPSSIDSINSNGFVTFQVDQVDSLAQGTQFINTANVYFIYQDSAVNKKSMLEYNGGVRESTNQTTHTLFDYILSQPPLPSIYGSASVCMDTIGSLYFTEPGMSNYDWIVSSGGTIISSDTTNAVTVLWNTAGNQSLSVSYADTNGIKPFSPSLLHVIVHELPNPSLTGLTDVCESSSNNVYQTDSAIAYMWSISSGGSITSVLNDSIITVNWDSAGMQWVSVNYTNIFGCAASTPTVLNVFVNQIPSTPVISQSNDTLYSSAQSGNQWYLNGVLIPGAIEDFYTPNLNGFYHTIVTENECASLPSDSILVTITGLSEQQLSDIIVYPNPNTGAFSIQFIAQTGEEYSIEVFNALRELVWQKENFASQGLCTIDIDLQKFTSGVYLIRISNSKTTALKKVIVESSSR